jgi:hypothetical protein
VLLLVGDHHPTSVRVRAELDGRPEMVESLVTALRARLSGIQVDPLAGEVLRWTGPRLFLLIDDYDLIATATATRCTPCSSSSRRRATSACTWS